MDRRQRRRTGSRDGNAAGIIAALLEAGCSVLELSIGSGCPDLLVGWTVTFLPKMILMEIKNPEGRNRVEEKQRQWAAEWRGTPVVVVRSAAEALRALGLPPTPTMG